MNDVFNKIIIVNTEAVPQKILFKRLPCLQRTIQSKPFEQRAAEGSVAGLNNATSGGGR